MECLNTLLLLQMQKAVDPLRRSALTQQVPVTDNHCVVRPIGWLRWEMNQKTTLPFRSICCPVAFKFTRTKILASDQVYKDVQLLFRLDMYCSNVVSSVLKFGDEEFTP